MPVEPGYLTLGVFLLFSRFLLGSLFICLHIEQDEVSKITKGGRSGGAAYLLCRRLQAARLASLDLLWSWKLEVLATQSSLRSLSQSFSEAAEAPPHRYPWTKITHKQVLACESHGAFSTHISSCVVKVNGFLREVRGGTIKFLDPLYETQQIKTWRLLMSAALTSRA